ncbi:hypothetical protein LXL04_030278 [Taraxacum kok-saghyz]
MTDMAYMARRPYSSTLGSLDHATVSMVFYGEDLEIFNTGIRFHAKKATHNNKDQFLAFDHKIKYYLINCFVNWFSVSTVRGFSRFGFSTNTGSNMDVNMSYIFGGKYDGCLLVEVEPNPNTITDAIVGVECKWHKIMNKLKRNATMET